MTVLYLNDLKVYQHFGRNPAKGRRMPLIGIRQSACGIKWYGFIKKPLPHKMQTCAVVSLTRTKEPGFWEVHCDPRYREEIELWLIDNCR